MKRSTISLAWTTLVSRKSSARPQFAGKTRPRRSWWKWAALVNSRTFWHLIRLTLAGCLIHVAVSPAIAACAVPQYYRVRDFSNPQLGIGSLYIRVQAKDFKLDNLVCLTQNLREQHPEWKGATVLMFSSDEAAQQFDPSGMSVPI